MQVYCVLELHKKIVLTDLYNISSVLGYEEVKVTPKYQIVYKGEPARIECASGGLKYWAFNGIVVNSTYVQPLGIFIPETLEKHAGTYECSVRQGNDIHKVLAELEVAGKSGIGFHDC